jgi:ribonuclease HI
MNIAIYTDGSSKPHTSKSGGWAWVCIVTMEGRLKTQELEFWKSGGATNTTNNRMELMAIIKALEFLWNSSLLGNSIVVYSDSQYCVNGCNEWLQTWIDNGWNEDNVKNRDLWERMNRLLKMVKPKMEWVRGHDGNYHNERVDKLAVAAAERMAEKGKEVL